MQRLKVGVTIAATCLLSWASAVAYHVEPRTAAMSGLTDHLSPNNYVSQTVVCCWDSLERVELFAGTRGSSGYYHVAVYDGGALVMWADGTQYQNESWVKFENWNTHAGFTTGKEYKLQFSRGPYGGIQYYWDEDPYQYGQLIVGQQAYPDRDLACRVFGQMDTLGADWLSVQIHSFTPDTAALRLAHDDLGVRWLGDDLGTWNAWMANPEFRGHNT
jgi:hypothetical protein